MANFPSSVSTNNNLYIAVNGVQTTLAANILATDTTIQLTSTTGFPTVGFVTIDNAEIVLYTGISGANLTGCTRGADGTTALPHNTGVTVGATIVAAHHNLLKDEVIAIETALGANLANVFPATPTTGTGNVVLQTSPTITTPTINSPTLTFPALGTPASGVMTNVTGLPLTTGVTGVLPNGNTTATPNATASTIVSRDASINTKVNTVIENFSTTVTAAGTTTLSVTSAPIQQFTGTTTQTVTLPDATTLATGYQIMVLNRSTGAIAVNNNGGSLQSSVAATNQAIFTCTSTGSANGTWDVSTSSAASGGTVTNVSGTTNQITSTNPTTTPVLALANPLTLPGAMTAGGAIAMGTNKITGLGNGSAAQDAVAFNQLKSNNIVATNTNDNATAGNIGEYVSSFAQVSAASFAATGVWFNITSISLTAGDWDVSGLVENEPGATSTSTEWALAISVNSGSTITDQVAGDNQLGGVPPITAQANSSLSIPTYRISISTTTTVYLKVEISYSNKTGMRVDGRISARRAR